MHRVCCKTGLFLCKRLYEETVKGWKWHWKTSGINRLLKKWRHWRVIAVFTTAVSGNHVLPIDVSQKRL